MFNILDNLNRRPLAFTDIETTGHLFGEHEIIEIGLVVADQQSCKVIDRLNIKTRPVYIESATPEALRRNGYKPEDWANAVPLKDAIEMYASKTINTIFVAYNATFDWGFMNMAFQKTGVIDQMDYHRLDVLSIAWAKGMNKSDKWNLKVACEMFGVSPEPEPHSAFNGAMTCYELYKKIISL